MRNTYRRIYSHANGSATDEKEREAEWTRKTKRSRRGSVTQRFSEAKILEFSQILGIV